MIDERPEFTAQSDEELIREANDGLQGQGASVEMMRRLRLAIEKADGTAGDLNRKLLWCTIAVFGLTVVQVILGVNSCLRSH